MRLNSALLQSMKGGKELGFSGRYRLLSPIIRDSFALPLTARIAAGRYWGSFSEAERREYLKAYTEWTVAAYAGRFSDYAGERFGPVSGPAPSGAAAVVASELVKSGGEPVRFDYRLRRIGGEWRIADIRIEGVSQLALTRSQFTSILKKKGYPGLITTLRSKIRKLSREKGE